MENNQAVKQKKKLSKGKKIAIIIAAVVAVILIVVAVYYFVVIKSGRNIYLGPIYESKEQVYEYFAQEPHNELCYELSDKKFNKISDKYIKDGEKDSETGIYETAKKPTAEMQEEIDVANQFIEDFFVEEYGFSVEEEIEELTVLTIANLEEETGAGGVYFLEGEDGFDGKTIVVDEMYISDLIYAKNDTSGTEYNMEVYYVSFYEVYIHETLHYLGCAAELEDSIDMMYVFEGITEALTIDVIEFAGYELSDSGAYIFATKFAEQILVADKELVELLVAGEGLISAEEWYDHFDSNSFDGMGYAITKSVTFVEAERSNVEHQIIAQHIVGEYVKNFELTPEEQIEIADSFVRPISDVA
ncbi:MAG: hypothetical protein E7536_03720 [Ruminococcaceae bacterium]|nr:hypothetical protein [Oscillospiraceae bacterium]